MVGSLGLIGADIKKIISVAAPGIAALLGGPFASLGITLLGSAFGVNSKDLDSISTTISQDPEAALKLKTLEFDHSETLAKLNAQDFQTEVSDKQDARKYSSIYSDFLRHFAYLITMGFFGALFLLFVPLQISAEEKQLLSMLVGMLASKWQTIVDFFFGSSRQQHSQGETNGSYLSK